MYPFPTHFTQTIARMWNLTSEAWIFWHLFFTLGMAAVIAFEGSLIHLRRTLPCPSRKHDWYLTRPPFISSHVGAVFVAVSVFWGAHTAFQFGALLRDSRLISKTAFYFPSCVCGSFFWRLICSSVHRSDISVCFFSSGSKVGSQWWWRDLSRKLRWGENSDKVSNKFKEKY